MYLNKTIAGLIVAQMCLVSVPFAQADRNFKPAAPAKSAPAKTTVTTRKSIPAPVAAPAPSSTGSGSSTHSFGGLSLREHVVDTDGTEGVIAGINGDGSYMVTERGNNYRVDRSNLAKKSGSFRDLTVGDTVIDRDGTRGVVAGIRTDGSYMVTERGNNYQVDRSNLAKTTGDFGGLKVGDRVLDRDGSTGVIAGIRTDGSYMVTERGNNYQVDRSNLRRIGGGERNTGSEDVPSARAVAAAESSRKVAAAKVPPPVSKANPPKVIEKLIHTIPAGHSRDQAMPAVAEEGPQ